MREVHGGVGQECGGCHGVLLTVGPNPDFKVIGGKLLVAVVSRARTAPYNSDWGINVDFLVPTNEEPKSIDNTKKGKVCPNCGVTL